MIFPFLVIFDMTGVKGANFVIGQSLQVPNTTTLAVPNTVIPLTAHAEKSKKFNGMNFKAWK